MNKEENNFPICQSEVGFFVELVEKNGFVVKSIKPCGVNDYKIKINIPGETKSLFYKRIQSNLEKNSTQRIPSMASSRTSRFPTGKISLAFRALAFIFYYMYPYSFGLITKWAVWIFCFFVVIITVFAVIS